MYDFNKYGPFVKKYYDSLDEGRVMALRCLDCGTYSWPAYPVCENCGHSNTEWVELSGEATIDEVAAPAMKGSPLGQSPLFTGYSGYRGCSGFLAEGPAFNNVVFGLDESLTFDEVNGMLPLKVQAEIIQLEGTKTVAFRVKEPQA